MTEKTLVPAMEEIIVDRNPVNDAEVRIVDKTNWIYSDDSNPIKNVPGAERAVRCKISEVSYVDTYGMPISTQVVIHHQFYDTKQRKWDNGVAASLIRPDAYMSTRNQDGVIPGLKDRFKTAIAEYLKVLVREGRDIPIAFLTDKVYPEVLNCLVANQIHTVNAFAALEDLDLFKKWMEKALLSSWTSHAGEFQKRAKQMLSELGVQEPVAASRKKAA